MKILMAVRPELLNTYGGDRIQIESTAQELRKLGIEVDITTDINCDMSGYDIVHVFQLDWNPACYFYIKKAKEFGKPVVFSPIHHKLKEVERFEKEYVFDFRRFSILFFKDQFSRDLFKDIYRSILNPKKAGLTFYSLTHGIKSMYKKAIEQSDILLTQTSIEADDLKKVFSADFKWTTVLNGVSENFLQAKNSGYINQFDISDYIVCVGRIEPRKNQLSVIKAVELLRNKTNEDIKLIFVGSKSKNKHFEYNWRFDSYLKKYNWIKHFSRIPYENMPSVYKFSKVGVSASWFETTGLTSLEALICGANAVAAGEQAKEYLGDLAYYCDPGDVNSIYTAIKNAYYNPPKVLPDDFREKFTWKNAALSTLEVYKKLI